MLISFKEIRGHVLRATDGEIGRCKDFLFDDESWTVRYMVADTRKWLPGRQVLLSPLHLTKTDWAGETLSVDLSRAQIKDSPEIDEDAPVSRYQEKRWADYFGYRRYWAGPMAWGPVGTQVGPVLPVDPSQYRPNPAPELEVDDSVHVRSCDEMVGYVVRADNGEFGHVADVLIDPARWKVCSWVVASRDLASEQHVAVAVTATESIDWHARTVSVSRSREALAGAASLSA